MMKRSHHIGVSLPLVGDMLCSLLTLPTGLQWVYEGYDMERGVLRTEYLVAALLLMGDSLSERRSEADQALIEELNNYLQTVG